eukprot:gnl/MRDRNA2_/MRDRNA2_17469_c0_seq1.p1 gnl/MRDRNA2_/MRDRNA2_17469_c0~~gnl/MRDRNA2_/MRDRNA2_17469_c0_seq1.p1  ORF type:complete len:560 (-),score=58.46 gnl/MRDRNA2_/MRDRNA2_17469_c0_seq1:52-1596(-)
MAANKAQPSAHKVTRQVTFSSSSPSDDRTASGTPSRLLSSALHSRVISRSNSEVSVSGDNTPGLPNYTSYVKRSQPNTPSVSGDQTPVLSTYISYIGRSPPTTPSHFNDQTPASSGHFTGAGITGNLSPVTPSIVGDMTPNLSGYISYIGRSPPVTPSACGILTTQGKPPEADSNSELTTVLQQEERSSVDDLDAECVKTSETEPDESLTVRELVNIEGGLKEILTSVQPEERSGTSQGNTSLQVAPEAEVDEFTPLREGVKVPEAEHDRSPELQSTAPCLVASASKRSLSPTIGEASAPETKQVITRVVSSGATDFRLARSLTPPIMRRSWTPPARAAPPFVEKGAVKSRVVRNVSPISQVSQPCRFVRTGLAPAFAAPRTISRASKEVHIPLRCTTATRYSPQHPHITTQTSDFCSGEALLAQTWGSDTMLPRTVSVEPVFNYQACTTPQTFSSLPGRGRSTSPVRLRSSPMDKPPQQYEAYKQPVHRFSVGSRSYFDVPRLQSLPIRGPNV